jgi:hypothetical protein
MNQVVEIIRTVATSSPVRVIMRSSPAAEKIGKKHIRALAGLDLEGALPLRSIRRRIDARFQKLYDETDFKAKMDELVQLGAIALSENRYVLTKSGQALLQEYCEEKPDALDASTSPTEPARLAQA